MTIKKRKTFPDPVTEPTHHEESHYKGRNPHLNGLRLDVYTFIQNNEGCTRSDVAKGLKLPNNVATARIKELIDEGFVYEPGGMKRNSSGVRARMLAVTGREQGGRVFDRVHVKVEIGLDINGRYAAKAYVQGNSSGKPVSALLRKNYTLSIPRDEVKDEGSISRIEGSLADIGGGLTIDADFIKVEKS